MANFHHEHVENSRHRNFLKRQRFESSHFYQKVHFVLLFHKNLCFLICVEKKGGGGVRMFVFQLVVNNKIHLHQHNYCLVKKKGGEMIQPYTTGLTICIHLFDWYHTYCRRLEVFYRFLDNVESRDIVPVSVVAIVFPFDAGYHLRDLEMANCCVVISVDL